MDNKDPFWSNIPHEKSTIVKKKRKVKYGREFCKKLHQTEVAGDRKLSRKKALTKRPKLKKNQIHSKHFLNDIPALPKAEERKPREAFTLYVRSRDRYAVEFVERPTLMELKGAIEDKEQMPENLQLITHKGKLLKPCRIRLLDTGDTVHVIVKGCGGGKSKSASKTPKPLEEYTEKCENAGIEGIRTEDDVEKWLTETVKVPRSVLERIDLGNLDAETLRDYTDYQDLKEELGFPLGLSKKIIYYKNAPIGKTFVSDMDTYVLESITVSQISTMMEEYFKEQKDKDTLSEAIRTEYIDGLVVMLYDDPAQLSRDISVPKLIARKFLANMKKWVKESAKNSSDTQSSKHETDTKQIETDAQTRMAFLSDSLGFNVLNYPVSNDLPLCHVYAIHNSWEKCNALAEQFLFWIICDQDNTPSGSEKSKLWKTIVDNIPMWLETLPTEERSKFQPGKKEGSFQFMGNKTVKVGIMGETLREFGDVTSETRRSYGNHIVIAYKGAFKTLSSPVRLRIDDSYVNMRFSIEKCWHFKDDAILRPGPSMPEENELGGEQTYKLEYYGHMKDKYDQETSCPENTSVTRTIRYQRQRPFSSDGMSTIYYEGFVIERPECGSGTVVPSLEFKYFQTSVKHNPIQKFLLETLRFACGCLNRRRNGTIFFGIADDKPLEGEKRVHGEVVGFPIIESDDVSKNRYTEELEKEVRRCFQSPESTEAALECIKAPKFVKVLCTKSDLPMYVMEVDIEASSCFCKGVKFILNLSSVIGRKEKPFLFIRDGAGTTKIDNESDEKLFFSSMQKYDEARQKDELLQQKGSQSPPSDHKYLAEKLLRKFSKGNAKFDSSIWPILVCNKPTDGMKRNIYEMLTFISHISFISIFEFDDESMGNGLAKHYFDGPDVTHSDGSLFRDIENNNELRNRLCIPEKSVFIFCNGRQDTNRTPHLPTSEWKMKYSANIKAAVNFFQQRSVVPLNRALVLFLMFSSDIEGFLDIYGEMIQYFGCDQVMLVSEDLDIFDKFKQSALLQQVAPENVIEQTSVVGMTWQQVDECIKGMVGVKPPRATFIPCSNGATVVVEKNFEEMLDTLEIISTDECEERKFESLEQKKQFGSERELRFYQGNRVEWWNFYFKDHVMKRHCFRQLRKKVHDALTTVQVNIKLIFLKHEPGAGGSTLARHILWEFHKDFRCSVVTVLKEKTATDILSLWKYKEGDHANPVLLLIDSIPEQEIDIDDLVRLLMKNADLSIQHTHPICVLLICVREEIASTPKIVADILSNEYLSQKVHEDEREWLMEKIQKLEESSRNFGLPEFRGEYFISFMVLHSNFNLGILEDTIGNLLTSCSQNRSYKLLVFIALVVSYVSPPRGGAPIAIPIEACSEFMGVTRYSSQRGKPTLWENELDSAIRVLLLIESKEHGVGKQIRIAHHTLAQLVIKYHTKTDSLASIAKDFLGSEIIQTSSYAKAYVVRLCIEMLIRRKKEEYDDCENTKFSPLVENITSESKSFEPSADLLLMGFRIFKDSSIAHQLARLYQTNERYDEAKHWAEMALSLSPKRSDITHTLGLIFKNEFMKLKAWTTEPKPKPECETTLTALDLAFTALEHLKNASICDPYEINLYACLNQLSTIISIARFVTDVVDIRESDIHQYLIHDDFYPECVAETWKKYHDKFKLMYSEGLNTVESLDVHIYHNKRVYASQFSRLLDEEHRSSRFIKHRLPDMVQDFAGYFGENTDKDEPPIHLKSDLLKDEWHRRCILTLGGTRMVDVFKLLTRSKSQKERARTTENLKKIKNHLTKIVSSTAADYINETYVNIALAHLKQDNCGLRHVLDLCEEIIRLGKKGNALNQAHLFSMMLQWPRKVKAGVDYDHALMLKNIKHLQGEFKLTKQRKPKVDIELFKRENYRFNSVVQFYASKGKGLAAVSHHTQVWDGKKQNEFRDDNWENTTVSERMDFIHGFTRLVPNSNAINVVVRLRDFGIDHEGEIEIRQLRCKRPQTEARVSFVLGFSLSGPVVCHIRSTQSELSSLYPKYETDYGDLSERELMELKRKISVLKGQKDLSEKEQRLIQDETEIDKALAEIAQDAENQF